MTIKERKQLVKRVELIFSKVDRIPMTNAGPILSELTEIQNLLSELHCDLNQPLLTKELSLEDKLNSLFIENKS